MVDFFFLMALSESSASPAVSVLPCREATDRLSGDVSELLAKGSSEASFASLCLPHPQSGGASSHDGRERGYHGNHRAFSFSSLACVDCNPELRMRA